MDCSGLLSVVLVVAVVVVSPALALPVGDKAPATEPALEQARLVNPFAALATYGLGGGFGGFPATFPSYGYSGFGGFPGFPGYGGYPGYPGYPGVDFAHQLSEISKIVTALGLGVGLGGVKPYTAASAGAGAGVQPYVLPGPLTGGGLVLASNPDGTVTTYEISLKPINTTSLVPSTGAAPMPVATMSVDTMSVDTKPVDAKPVDTMPVDTMPVDTMPVDTKPVVPEKETEAHEPGDKSNKTS